MRSVGCFLILLTSVTMKAASREDASSSSPEVNSGFPTEAPSGDTAEVDIKTERSSGRSADVDVEIEGSTEVTADIEYPAGETEYDESFAETPSKKTSDEESSAEGSSSTATSSEESEETSDKESPADNFIRNRDSKGKAANRNRNKPKTSPKKDLRKKLTTKTNNSSSSDFQSRSLFQFKKLLFWGYGFATVKFVYYGNFCGYNGDTVGGRDGKDKPIDECDTCCQVHDNCYSGVGKCSPYTTRYRYKWSKENSNLAKCTDKSQSCARNVCKCDIALVDCLRKVSKVQKLC